MGIKNKEKHNSSETEYKKGHLPWNTGLSRKTDERINQIAKLKEGQPRSQETINKMRQKILALPNLKGNKGSKKHQKYVTALARSLKNKNSIVEVEKAVKISPLHWRIIDILVDNQLCYEVGMCRRDKIQDLQEAGFEVINLPYSCFRGDI